MRHQLALGSVIATTRPIIVTGVSTTIERGETGRIVDIDPDSGDLVVQLTRYHDCLRDWRNMIPITDRRAVDLVRSTFMTKLKRFGSYAVVLGGISFAALVVDYIPPKTSSSLADVARRADLYSPNVDRQDDSYHYHNLAKLARP